MVNLAAADRNIARAAAAFTAGPVRLRPHFKAHKCTRLLQRQLDAGGCSGVTCATAWEAEVLAEQGFGDILVANEVAGDRALAALGRAASRARITVCVDAPRHVELLTAVGARVGVLVEVDVGQGRCGVEPGSAELLRLAWLVADAPGLDLRGLQGYHGHAVLLESRSEREREVAAGAAILAAERERLQAAGLPCHLVSGGGTGTYDMIAAAGGVDEVQAGSYVLMDATYGRLGLPFEQALFCLATVISRRGTRIVLDAGLKALSAEYGMPGAKEPGLEVLALSDEHATARVPASCGLRVGDTTLLIPAHVDPTVNLHPTLHVSGPSGTFEAWPVDGRVQ
ncbi:MAG: alanine racemase domain protein [Solirubrobacterales bacterium]|jgi:D-serine deaminase-like pyridoxal phosphate-dependent protein|nr:alanine racemase domain protein [Solirubrobacterales bacterium]